MRNVLRAQPSRFLHERAIEREHFLDSHRHFMIDFCAQIIGENQNRFGSLLRYRGLNLHE